MNISESEIMTLRIANELHAIRGRPKKYLEKYMDDSDTAG